MAASVTGTIAVIDWLALVTVFSPPAETLTGVRSRTRLYTFGLQGADQCTVRHSDSREEAVNGVTHIHTAASSERRSTGVRLHTGDTVALKPRSTHTPETQQRPDEVWREEASARH